LTYERGWSSDRQGRETKEKIIRIGVPARKVLVDARQQRGKRGDCQGKIAKKTLWHESGRDGGLQRRVKTRLRSRGLGTKGRGEGENRENRGVHYCRCQGPRKRVRKREGAENARRFMGKALRKKSSRSKKWGGGQAQSWPAP